MGAILQQLGLDQTFFYQLVIFAVLFFLLTRIYFRPFLRLFEIRHEKTTQDRENAEKLMLEANAKLDEYKRQLAEERANAKRQYDSILDQAKQDEGQLLARARDDAKKITQEAVDSVNSQREKLRHELERDIESLARMISEKLLSRKV